MMPTPVTVYSHQTCQPFLQWHTDTRHAGQSCCGIQTPDMSDNSAVVYRHQTSQPILLWYTRHQTSQPILQWYTDIRQACSGIQTSGTSAKPAVVYKHQSWPLILLWCTETSHDSQFCRHEGLFCPSVHTPGMPAYPVVVY